MNTIIKKTVVPGTLDGSKLYIEIDFDGKRLSICGKSRYSSGQISFNPADVTLAPGWSLADLTRLREVWDTWHLNDMHAGCCHQRAAGWGKKELTLVTYGEPAPIAGVTTTNSLQLKSRFPSVHFKKADVWANVRQVYHEFVAKPKNPDAANILWFTEKFNCKRKEEKKTDGWVRPTKHPEGKLGKLCPECGYGYGTKWLHEDVPADVVEFLTGLPDLNNDTRSPYEIEADDFLQKYGITFKATQKGDKCPLWCDGEHVHGKHYQITFRHPDRKSLTLSFWNSLNDAEKGIHPTAYDVITAITKNDPGDFSDFCGDYGYDTDSRKAEKIYKLVEKEWEKVSAFFDEEELEELRYIQ